MGCSRYTEWYAHKPGNATTFQQPKKPEKGREDNSQRSGNTMISGLQLPKWKSLVRISLTHAASSYCHMCGSPTALCSCNCSLMLLREPHRPNIWEWQSRSWAHSIPWLCPHTHQLLHLHPGGYNLHSSWTSFLLWVMVGTPCFRESLCSQKNWAEGKGSHIPLSSYSPNVFHDCPTQQHICPVYSFLDCAFDVFFYNNVSVERRGFCFSFILSSRNFVV